MGREQEQKAGAYWLPVSNACRAAGLEGALGGGGSGGGYELVSSSAS